MGPKDTLELPAKGLCPSARPNSAALVLGGPRFVVAVEIMMHPFEN
jgi:hypothetical protein